MRFLAALRVFLAAGLRFAAVFRFLAGDFRFFAADFRFAGVFRFLAADFRFAALRTVLRAVFLAAGRFLAADLRFAAFLFLGAAARFATGFRLAALRLAAGFFLTLLAMLSAPPVGCDTHTRVSGLIRFESVYSLSQMSKNSIQIIARGTRADVDAASEIFEADVRLEGIAFSLLAENEELNVWRIDAFPNTAEDAEVLAEHLNKFRALTIKKVRLADADWLAMALSGLPPVVEGRFVLFGEHDSSRIPINAKSLEIDAGAAFGTGHHGTTAGCLAAFDQLLKRRRFERVLDVGSGTGVLAIAAARTGSRRVLGVDIDAVSVRISGENAKLNGARARFVHASGLNHPTLRAGRPYDLVFANILARPLIALAQDIRGALKPGGIAILSGLLRTQERQVKAAYLARGFALEGCIPRDAWQTLILRKR